MSKWTTKVLTTDLLIIGGGTAGCYAALTAAENSSAKVIIAEKAHIKRSGCLAAGVNALNAYIVKGQTPESYVDYCKRDAEGILREDLSLTMSQGLNRATHKMEQLGLVILKDEQGEYVSRGTRNLKINGENIKPILAQAVEEKETITVLNRVNIIDYLVKDGQVVGAYGFSIEENIFYLLHARATICATGGAAGLYRPNNPGFSRHKMWYPPFNTGAGYAMGIRAGAEMTTFEMRFIALRCKDTIAPTGTLAQGVGAKQVNALGENYETKYGSPITANRVYATVKENQAGRGPCVLKTDTITPSQADELYKAYLNMAPAQTLKWVESGVSPHQQNVEIEGSEPYIVGGHTSSGYWVDTHRATTLKGLYAAGDVAGGCPQKYVTGCFVEGEIAALAALNYLKTAPEIPTTPPDFDGKLAQSTRFLSNTPSPYTVFDLEEAMQKTMDEYAGGISQGYCYNFYRLNISTQRISELQTLANELSANDLHELLLIYELIDRLLVCQVVIAHLKARKETRWHAFQENADYPNRDDENFSKYVNSRYHQGEIEILYRDLVRRDEQYEHPHP